MINALALGGVALSFLIPPTSSPTPAAVPPPGAITVQLATANGTGCRPSNTAVALDPTNSFFTMTYSDFTAGVGPGFRPQDSRKNCQINVIVHVPQGYTYAIARVDYRGFASLKAGAYGIERANYYFQGMQQTATIAHRFNGAYEDVWAASDAVPIESLIWRPCGENRNFNINSELVVNAGTSPPTATSFMAMDSTDLDIRTIYHFAWRSCP